MAEAPNEDLIMAEAPNPDDTKQVITGKALLLTALKGQYGDVNGLFDVVNNYNWTYTKLRKNLNIPYIELLEYEQDSATLYAQLAYWRDAVSSGLGIGDNDGNPYKNLYHAKPTGTRFILPFFEQYHANTEQAWNVNTGLGNFLDFAKVMKAISVVNQSANFSPGVKTNQPRVWEGSEPASYAVNFTLFNTIGGDAEILKNLQFTRRIRLSTLHSQQNAVLAVPPAMFEISIPGIRFSPASVIKNVIITNLGQMNLMSVDKNMCNIPDAYGITINIQELIVESREIMAANIGGSGSFKNVRAILDYSNTLTEFSTGR